MSFGESLEFPGSVEGTVKFDKETCCALERAFKQNPGVAKELEAIVGGEENMRNLTDVLPHADELTFDQSEASKTVYGQIAKRELERIAAEDEDDEDLACGHSVDEHRQALQSVVEKMTPMVN